MSLKACALGKLISCRVCKDVGCGRVLASNAPRQHLTGNRAAKLRDTATGTNYNRKLNAATKWDFLKRNATTLQPPPLNFTISLSTVQATQCFALPDRNGQSTFS